jgi:uncharacterized protein (DUF433 family)
MNKRISINPNVCHGQACIAGTRITVHQILGMLAGGDTVDTLLTAYPSITKDDISACFEYASLIAEEEVSFLEFA